MTNIAKRKPGRPKIYEHERRNNVTQFRCTEEEYKLIEEAAEAKGQSLSDWIRDKAVRAARRSKSESQK